MSSPKDKKVSGVSLLTCLICIAVISSVLFVIFGYHTTVLPTVVDEMTNYSIALRECETDAIQMERSKTYLTRQVRLYVENWDPVYMDLYFDNINGKQRMESALEKLYAWDTDPEAAEAISYAANLSRRLMEQEIYVMKLVAVANDIDEGVLNPEVISVVLLPEDAALTKEEMLNKARELVFGGEYQYLHNNFERQIDTFRDITSNELQQKLEISVKKVDTEMRHQRMFVTFLAAISIALFLMIVLLLIVPLRSHISSIRKEEPFRIIGVTELKHLAICYNEAYAQSNLNRADLIRRAERDGLTGLMNRSAFDTLKGNLKDNPIPMALLIVDVDKFKQINDEYGHKVGDRSLQRVSDALRRSFHPGDYLIRYGGDEFVVIMMGMKRENTDSLKRKITKINESLMRPEGTLPPISISVGAAFSAGGLKDDLFWQADQSMYEVKRNGSCGLCVYDPTNGLLSQESTAQNAGHKPRVLLVDDTEMNREMLACMLEDSHEIVHAADGLEAIEYLDKNGHELSIMLLDLLMPNCDGYGVLSYMAKRRWNETLPVIVISAETDPDNITKAYEMGAVDFISRPFNVRVVQQRVKNTVELYRKNKRLASLVAQQIHEQTSSYDRMLSILSQVVEFRNQESGLHVLHINYITEMLLHRLKKIAPQYEITNEDIRRISTASSLHDIGKIAIPDEIINKPGKLTDEEFALMKTHSAEGADMLGRLQGYENDPLIHTAWEICRWHHERYDGRGYPDGLVGDAIPICAQVVSVADVYDALTSERCYKPPYSHEKAIEMIMGGECGAFNPLLLECLKEIANILPAKLNDDPIKLKQDREIARMTEEMSHYSELSSSNLLLNRLRFEQVRANFFEDNTSSYTFVYRSETNILTLSEESAQMLGAAESIHDPVNNTALLERSGKSGERWAQIRASASAEKPMLVLPSAFHMNGKTVSCRTVMLTIWSADETAEYLGVVGAIEATDET